MHHIRIVAPAESTQRIADFLVASPGVRNLVVLPGAGLPDGDAVQFDVTDGSANTVLQRLGDLSRVAAPRDVAFTPVALADDMHRLCNRNE